MFSISTTDGFVSVVYGVDSKMVLDVLSKDGSSSLESYLTQRTRQK